MPTKLLNDVKLRKAKCPKDQSILKLSDGGGLYLWIFANGKKHWRFRWQVDGKEQSLALGEYPHVSLTLARSRRDALQEKRAAGVDPSESRKAEQQAKIAAAANSFEAVAKEWYGKHVHQWSASHTRDVVRRLEANIFPALGKRPIAEMEAPFQTW